MKLSNLIRKGGLQRLVEHGRALVSEPSTSTVANVAVVAVAAAPVVPANISEWYQERAAIIEYDGDVTRQEAERAAKALTLARFSMSPIQHLH